MITPFCKNIAYYINKYYYNIIKLSKFACCCQVKYYFNMNNARDEIKILLLKNHMTMTELAKRMTVLSNRKISQSGLSQKLTNGTLRYDELIAICEILGYDLEFKKRT